MSKKCLYCTHTSTSGTFAEGGLSSRRWIDRYQKVRQVLVAAYYSKEYTDTVEC